jgi:Terminase large subunit, T4likevirus-type, N-terminal
MLKPTLTTQLPDGSQQSVEDLSDIPNSTVEFKQITNDSSVQQLLDVGPRGIKGALRRPRSSKKKASTRVKDSNTTKKEITTTQENQLSSTKEPVNQETTSPSMTTELLLKKLNQRRNTGRNQAGPDPDALPGHEPTNETVLPTNNVIFQPNLGPQSEFLAASEREVLFGGAAGGGKSYAMLADPLRDLANSHFSGILFRKSTEELRELRWKSQLLYPQVYPDIKWSERSQNWVMPNGGRLWMTYLDRDEDVLRYQGQAFNWIGFDELTQWATPFAYNYMRSRLRTTSTQLSLYMRATTNPGNFGAWWVKKMFIDPAPYNHAFPATDIDTEETLVFPSGHPKAGEPLFYRRFIPSRLQDNPYLWNDGEYEANLLSLPEIQRKQLLDGSWDIIEGAAFSEWDRKIHVIEPFDIPSNWRRFRALDYGYTSFSGCVWFAVAPSGQLIVYRDLEVSKVHAWDLADLIKSIEIEADEDVSYGVLDFSIGAERGQRGPTLVEQLQRHNLRWRPADRGKGSRIAGKNMIHRMLQIDEFTGEPNLVFFNTCTSCTSQLPVLPLDKTNPEDIDTKARDHIYDAVRYGVMSRPRPADFYGSNTFFKLKLPEWIPADETFNY